ncbi:hypothetical protein AmDm5_1229 [Acetobacter malorum]|nr:hypothetical protein AmDm5_1229 [Acetobacter malorum]
MRDDLRLCRVFLKRGKKTTRKTHDALSLVWQVRPQAASL